MADQTIASYMVGLGYKVDDTGIKEYMQQQADMEAKQQQAVSTGDKSSKQAKDKNKDQQVRLDGGKKEISLMGDMGKALKQLGLVAASLETGNIFGAFMQGEKSIKSLQDLFKNFGGTVSDTNDKTSKAPNTLVNRLKNRKSKANTADESGGNLPSTEKLKQAENNDKSIKEAPQVAEGAEAGKTEQRALAEGVTGEAVGGAGEAVAEGGLLAGAMAFAAPVAAVAAVTALAVGAAKMAASVAETNIEVETMSRQLWISNTAGWQLNNTLNAMGKSVSDLNTIALNPTLRKQFEDLQTFQRSQLALPSDMQAVSDKWALSVGEGNQKLSLAASMMKTMIGYDFEKAFAKPFADAANWLAQMMTDVDNLLGVNKNTAATVAPQGNGYNYASALTYNSSPTITVNGAGSPQETATAVGSVVNKVNQNNRTALIKTTLPVQR